MKTKTQIESRLQKLRIRYAHKHIEATQSRCFKNCKYNIEHTPKKLNYRRIETEMELAPRIQRTYLVIEDNNPTVHLCMYGAENAAKWLGETCDEDEKAKKCLMFKPIVSIEQAKSEFLEKLADDEYVFDNYRDIATLQWVLGKRIYDTPLTFFERFMFWLKTRFWKSETPRLPESSEVVIDILDK